MSAVLAPGPYRWVPPALRARRRPAKVWRAQLLVEAPCCASCGLDLDALSIRALEFDQAQLRAVLLVFGVTRRADGSLEPNYQRHLPPFDRFCPSRVVLRRMGFDVDRHLAEVDHEIPIWAGGDDTRENVRLLCQPCHGEKSADEAPVRAAAKRTWWRDNTA